MAEIKGALGLQLQLRSLAKSGAKRAQKKAMRAAIKPVAAAMKDEVPVLTGQTRKTETYKVTDGKNTGIAAIAGADVSKLNAQAESSGGKRPSNIDWLINEGHVMPDGTVVPPDGYRQRAEAASLGPALAIYTNVLRQQIEIEALKKS